ncbi:MAG: Serine/threonine-protein kinase PknB [Gemmatimonadetes bacterium]|nr:Serine/threonine-protein kinase PknB [Gemmatimonadota bacterium]
MTDLRDQLQRTLGDSYTLENELTGGGMARVFVAEEHRLHRKVVVKVLVQGLMEGISAERFEREIQLAARLQHPNIVPLIAAGETEGLSYFTMPYIRGESLRQRLAAGPISVPDALRMLNDLAQALAYAHDEGIVHRDIKPDNVLLTSGAAVVTDFGIAKAVSDARTTRAEQVGHGATLTQEGTSLGTPAYMAPEQVGGEHIDARTDIYSWGLLAYELLAGRHPFADRTTASQLMSAQLAQEPADLAALRPGLSPHLARLVMRCLEKEPDRRPSSARELIGVLTGIASGANDTVRRPRRSTRLVIGAIVAVLIGGVAWAAYARYASANAIRSLAVLPFETVGGDSTDAYLAQGIADELKVTLGKLHGVHVAPRISGAVIRARGLTTRDIARTLDVQGVLSGTVRRAGDRLRVTAELTDARDGSVVWTDEFEENRTDIFAVEDRITRAIVSALRLRLGGDAAGIISTRRTADAEAHDLYLRGRYFWSLRSEAGIKRAIEYFQQAVARDPEYVAAISGMADAYAVSAWYSYVPPAEGYGRAKELARQAIRLDSLLTEPHASLGYVALYYDWDWPEANRQFRRAIQLDSTYPTAHQWYGNYLVAMNQPTEAVAALRHSERLDPLNRVAVGAVCWGQYMLREYQPAVTQCNKALDLDSTFAVAKLWRGQSSTMLGDTVAALRDLDAAVRLSGRSGVSVAALAYAQARAGRAAAARALLTELTSPGLRYAPSYEIALVYAALGDSKTAFDWLDRAFRERAHSIALLRVDPALDPLRSDPRFDALLARAGAR